MTPLSGYLALGTLDATGTVFTEIVASGYARQSVALEPNAAGDIRNVAAVSFPVALADWQRFNAYAVFDAVSGSDLLMAWAVGQERLVRGARHALMAGDIRLTFPVPRSNFGLPVILSGPFVRSPQQLFAPPNQVILTQAEYDAIATPDERTIYFIADEA